MIDELQLYIPRSDDGWFYVKMMSDPETMAYNAPWFPPDGCIPDPDSGWVELQKSWIGKAPERFYAFLQRKTDGAFVGDVNYHHNPKQSWCDMGIVIFAPERGKGYGKQGLRLLLDRAFKVDGVSCLHNDFEDARIAAVCHEGTIMAMLCYALHADIPRNIIHVANCAVCAFKFGNGVWELGEWNETGSVKL